MKIALAVTRRPTPLGHDCLNAKPIIEVAQVFRRHGGTPIRWCRDLP